MSQETNIAEVVAQGAALLSGTRPTEKAAPVEETEKAAPEVEDTEKGEMPEAFKKAAEDKKDDAADEKDEKDTEKAVGATATFVAAHETPEFQEAVTKAVEKALAPVLAALAPLTEVEKSLEVVTANVEASLKHQAATTDVLVGLRDAQVETREVAKSVKTEVETIGAQPAGRKSLETRDVEKSAPAEEKVDIDLDKLREVTKSMDTVERLTVTKLAKRGDVAGVSTRLNSAQRKALGL